MKELPPCERGYASSQLHPRFPSGDCVVCGASCIEECKHPNSERNELDDIRE